MFMKIAETQNHGTVFFERASIDKTIETFKMTDEQQIKTFIRNSVVTSGCMVARITPEVLAAFAATPIVAELYSNLKEGYMITLIDDFLERHSEKEVEAIIWHEMGHIAKNHLVTMPKETLECGGLRIIQQKEKEFEADDFAMCEVMPVHLHSGLTKIPNGIADVLDKYNRYLKAPMPRQEFLDTVFNVPEFQERLTRIKARC